MGSDDGDATTFVAGSLQRILLHSLVLLLGNNNAHLKLHLERELSRHPEQDVRRRRVCFEEQLRRRSVGGWRRATDFVGVQMDEIGERGWRWVREGWDSRD